jgi:hypothetical protein
MKKYAVVSIIIFAVLSIACSVLLVTIYAITHSESSQLAAERLNADNTAKYQTELKAADPENGDKTPPDRFAQLSVFIAGEAAFNTDAITQFRRTIVTEYQKASITTGAGMENLFFDAYSAETPLTIGKPDSALAISANATAVGGDYFKFHRLPLLGGYYLNGSETDRQVVLDEILAWQLFGSYNIAGLDVEINNTLYTVTGVVSREWGTFYSSVYGGERPRIYIPYESLTASGAVLNITCYELLAPNPVSDFAMKILKDGLGVDSSRAVYIENSKRITIFGLFENLSGISKRVMKTNNVIFPFWENIAAVKADTSSRLLLAAAILLLLIVIFAVVQGIIIWRKLDLINKIKNKYSMRR